MAIDPRALPKTPDGYREAWTSLEQTSAGTVEHAQRLPEPKLHERVDEEWSFVETLRHLVFATDRWIGRNVLELDEPCRRLGMPPDSRGPASPSRASTFTPFGLDVMADASFDEVLSVRSGRQQQVREIVDGLTADELGRAGGAAAAPGFGPGATFPVSQCLDVVIAEEWAHHGYAARDLAILEARHLDST